MEKVYSSLGVTRQGIWQSFSVKNKKDTIEEEIIKKVIDFRVSHPKMGARPLFHSMVNHGINIPVGITKFEKILRTNDLNVGSVKTYKPQTSDGKGKENYTNLINGLKVNDINQVLVADMTYYYADDQWRYIMSLKDVYSQFMNIEVSIFQDAEAALACLERWVKLRGKKNLQGCIHHSDNGGPYNSKIYKNLLCDLGMIISRAETCVQNGSSEQSHNVVKNMYFEPWGVASFEEMIKAREKFLRANNYERAIKQLGNRSPVEFEKHIKNIPMEERSSKVLFDFTTQNEENGFFKA